MKANIALGSFEFNSVNYQFPEIAEDEDIYDRNWLTVNIVIADQYGKSSEFTDSCVLTWELQDAIEGLVDVLDGKSDEFEACFLEPYFAMSVKKTDNGFDFYAAYFDMRMGKSKEISVPGRITVRWKIMPHIMNSLFMLKVQCRLK